MNESAETAGTHLDELRKLHNAGRDICKNRR
jgi:hypothetical protein